MIKQFEDQVSSYLANMYPYRTFISILTVMSTVMSNLVSVLFLDEGEQDQAQYFKRIQQMGNWWFHIYLLFDSIESFIFISQRYYQLKDFFPILLENYSKYFFWHFIIMIMLIQQPNFFIDSCTLQKPAILELLLITFYQKNCNSCGNALHYYASYMTNFISLLVVYAIYIFVSKQLKIQVSIQQILFTMMIVSTVIAVFQFCVNLKSNPNQHYYFNNQSINSPTFYFGAFMTSQLFAFDYHKEHFTQQLAIKVEDQVLYQKLVFLLKHKSFGDIAVVIIITIDNYIINYLFPSYEIQDYTVLIILRIVLAKYIFIIIQFFAIFMFLFKRSKLISHIFEPFNDFYQSTQHFLMMAANGLTIVQKHNYYGYEFGPSSNIIKLVFCIENTLEVYIISWLMDKAFGKFNQLIQQQIRQYATTTKIKYIRLESKEEN